MAGEPPQGAGRHSCAAIISAEDLELLEALEDRIDLAAARKALKEPRRTWDEVKAELGL